MLIASFTSNLLLAALDYGTGGFPYIKLFLALPLSLLSWIFSIKELRLKHIEISLFSYNFILNDFSGALLSFSTRF